MAGAGSAMGKGDPISTTTKRAKCTKRTSTHTSKPNPKKSPRRTGLTVRWLRGVLWRARWSWTWTGTASNVGDELDVNLRLPLLVWVGFSFFFFFYLWLWLWLWLRLFFGPRQIPWVVVFGLHFFLRFFSFFL